MIKKSRSEPRWIHFSFFVNLFKYSHRHQVKKLIAFTVREILKDVFKVPANDGPVKYFEINENDWFIPDGWKKEKVFIELLILPGRKKETKAKLLKEITEQVSNILKINKNAIIITIHEPLLDNWGLKIL
ncbi:tautomerase family protein [Bacillus pseudomycoides]|uniref:tautomerase family protein n=1 Tax=Bacillus pseudomycoides TaxID=64104 RepID=UPI002FFE56D8